MRPLHHASVFSSYIFPKYIYFFGFTSFTVDSLGLLEYFGICIVMDESLTFPVFLPQVTPSPVGCNEKPMFGPRLDPGAAKDE